MRLNRKILKIKKLKKIKKKIVCLTAYSKPIAKILDKYCDIILIGDSVATAFYGMKNTRNINLETMINHGISVKKNVNQSVVVFDMPHNTYRTIIEAKKRLINRQTESEKSLKKRIKKMESELKFAKNMDVQLVNDDLEITKKILYTHVKSFLTK